MAPSSHRRRRLPPPGRYRGRRGVVAVIVDGPRLLVIRRSQRVTAPGLLCLPGGGIEPGETEPQALVREMSEELAVRVEPARRLWRSQTPWGTRLAWWLAVLDDPAEIVPNPVEVAAVYWMTPEELELREDALPSVPHFVRAMAGGTVQLDPDLPHFP